MDPDSFKQYDRGWIVVVMPYDKNNCEYVIFSEEAPTLADIELVDGLPGLGGLYDYEHVDNPFRDHHVIHIPYCTGDIHWGDATVAYTDTLETTTAAT